MQLWTGRRPERSRTWSTSRPRRRPTPGVDTRFALASAVAWAGARGSKQIDLRRGPFVYKASFSILRQKAAAPGRAGGGRGPAAVTIDATMALARLRDEREQLQAQLKRQTQELFGEPRMDGRQVATLLKRSFKDEMAPIPKATAYDLLGEISRRVPAGERSSWTSPSWTSGPRRCSSAARSTRRRRSMSCSSKLDEIECFEDITKGPINEVSGGAKSFTLTIASKCP